MDSVDAEDILSDALEFIGGGKADFEENLSYGPITVTTAPKEGKANTLLADHIFSPALLLAERIERGLFPVSGRSMIELGAGAALPSLVAAIQQRPPSLVVATDYPDELILSNLRCNIAQNSVHVSSACTLHVQGYEWGLDVASLLQPPLLPPDGYDIVVLSDLLHFDQSHGVLLHSLLALLSRTPTARAYVGAGIYTRASHYRSFLRKAESAGLMWLESGEGEDGRETDTTWRGGLPIRGVDTGGLGERKGMCRWWIAGWAPQSLT
ncbi:hypothetical protein K488DRAFT_41868 [Vararia minispora EC-137]|uniref:Uncharacterized protein n=1 Tax=Vararia minispora EC-137 TaxID=1314806 RepID=A0ACB8QX30_9AGAM|nr:hypothetical protein K488DRAFT_41868 [Vararia minispora EC-137]